MARSCRTNGRPVPRGTTRRRWDGAVALVLGSEQQRGERVEGGHELIELIRLQALVWPGREGVGERLDSLFDGAPPLAQPTVLPDQAATAHPVDHGGELRCWKVVDAPELLRRHVHAEREKDV